MSTITTEVLDFILKGEPSPYDLKNRAIVHIIDGIAVMLAGSRRKCVKILTDFIMGKQVATSSTIIGFDFKTSPSEAALVNGTAGHADDYDDTQITTSQDRIYGLLTHPTVPVLSAALALGEKIGCSGRSILEAFIMGFEVECKLAESVKPEHYKRGFHTTGTIGAFGACAASCSLLRLDDEGVRYALGITASMSSGIRANFGTMTKPLHAGMAAYNGVTAALLAERGFTADREALDGPWGFMSVLGHGFDEEKIVGKLGKPYSLIQPGASIKLYPCGSLLHPSMDTLLEIVLEEDIKPDDVREIRLRAGPNILNPLRYDRPVNALQAKFSIQFGLGCILARRRASLREYIPEALKSREIVEAMNKVRTFHDPKLAGMGTDKMRSVIEVELRDGSTFSRLAEAARGTPEKPLKSAELFGKFRECAGYIVGERKIVRIYSRLRNIENLNNINELTSLLQRAR